MAFAGNDSGIQCCCERDNAKAVLPLWPGVWCVACVCMCVFFHSKFLESSLYPWQSRVPWRFALVWVLVHSLYWTLGNRSFHYWQCISSNCEEFLCFDSSLSIVFYYVLFTEFPSWILALLDWPFTFLFFSHLFSPSFCSLWETSLTFIFQPLYWS